MSRYVIYFEVSKNMLDLKKIFDLIKAVKNDAIEVHIINDKGIYNSQLLNDIIGIEQEAGKKRDILFFNYYQIRHSDLKRKVLKDLKYYGIRLEIIVDKLDINKRILQKELKYIKKYNIYYRYIFLHCTQNDLIEIMNIAEDNFINIDIPILEDNFEQAKEIFNKWRMGTGEYSIKVFEEIISAILLRTSTNDCKHGSCIGRTFRLSQSGDLYNCREKNAVAYIGNINEISHIMESVQDALECYLIDIIKKRNLCKENCDKYGVCQGGCYIKSDFECKDYLALVEYIERYLLSAISDKQLPQNKVIRKFLIAAEIFKQNIVT